MVDGLAELPLGDRVSAVRHMLPVLVSMATKGYVDGFSDIPELPPEVADSLASLRDQAPAVQRTFGRARRTYMAIPVDLGDHVQFSWFRMFAPYSIHAELVYEDDDPVLVMHDTSTSVEVIVQPEFVTSIETALPSGAVLRGAI